MKKITILLVLLMSGFGLNAQQTCDCKQELDFMYEQIKTTESYKHQVKGDLTVRFEEKYQHLGKQMSAPMTEIACFQKLTELLSLIKDKHAFFMGTATDYKALDIDNPDFVKSYRKSEAFTSFPKTERDLISLEAELRSKPLEDVEGIYRVEGFRLGMFRTEKKDSLVAVVLETSSRIWEPGQVFLYMTATGSPGHYDMIMYSQTYKIPVYKPMQWVEHGILYGSLMKESLKANHSYIDESAAEPYQLKSLNDKVQYLWLDGFRLNSSNAKKRDALLAQMDSDLKADHLIVDLRNNGGGASKISMPIVKRIRKYAKKGKVYVLTNKMSGSNAEQTTLRLIKMADATHLGQRTHGALAYGLNYGTRMVSPSGKFQFYPTDMKFSHYLKYEEVGVEPAIKLSPESDWIAQTLNIINTKSL